MLGRFGLIIYGPTTIFALGEGAVIPLIPLVAAERGADAGLAAFVAGLLVVGQLFGNLPAGAAVPRLGERRTMAWAGVVVLVGAVAAALAPGIPALGAAAFLIGVGAAGFGVARHAFMTTRVPLRFRARALSLLGGTFRFGMFVGPFAAAALIAWFGDEHAAIWFLVACTAAAVALVLVGPDPERAIAAEPSPAEAPDRPGVLRTMVAHRRVLMRLGLAAASLSAVRAARQIVLPLFGLLIGLDASTISVVIGVAGAVDFTLFYASGQVMDRFGRLWAALPAMVLMGAGYLALAATASLPDHAMWFAMFAVVIAVGNGLSSGILLTLGADTAPQDDPGPYLGSWRTLTDAGGALTTVLVAGVTALLSLPAASAVMGVLGLVGAAGFVRWIPRFVGAPARRREKT